NQGAGDSLPPPPRDHARTAGEPEQPEEPGDNLAEREGEERGGLSTTDREGQPYAVPERVEPSLSAITSHEDKIGPVEQQVTVLEGEGAGDTQAGGAGHSPTEEPSAPEEEEVHGLPIVLRNAQHLKLPLSEEVAPATLIDIAQAEFRNGGPMRAELARASLCFELGLALPFPGSLDYFDTGHALFTTIKEEANPKGTIYQRAALALVYEEAFRFRAAVGGKAIADRPLAWQT